MAIINSSTKFGGAMHEVCITAGGYVILRSVLRQQDRVVMTATASEDEPEGPSLYPDQERLYSAAEMAFEAIGGIISHERDHKGRPYVQTIFMDSWATVAQVAQKVADILGLGDVRIGDQVMADFWHDNSVNEDDEDELVYLSDGMSVDRNGNLVKTG